MELNETREIRDEQGRFIPGVSGNPEGRKPDTSEQKIEKKAVKQLVDEYRQSLAESLPQITPVLIRQAVKGEIQAIKEINDRVMGKSPQSTDITSNGETLQPLLVKFLDAKPDRDTSGVQETL